MNVVYNFLTIVLGIMSSLFLTPYLVHRLGVAAFGLVPLVNILISYFGIMTLVVNAASARFVTIAISRGEYSRAQKIFSTAFWSLAVVNTVIMMLGFAGSLNINSLINVPAGYVVDAKILFSLAVFTWLFTSTSSLLGISIFSANRLDIQGMINSSQRAIYFVLSILLIKFVSPRPYLLGVAMLAGGVCMFLLNLAAFKKFLPWMKFTWGFDRIILKEITSFGTWVSIDRLGTMLLTTVDVILVNVLLGPTSSGEYATLLQWAILIRVLGIAVTTAFGPTMAYNYASSDTVQLISTTRRAIRFTSMVVGLPICVIGGFAAPVLGLWLGKGFEALAPLLVVITFPMAITVGLYPLTELQQTISKVRLPGLVTIIVGVLNVALCFYFVYVLKWGMYGIAVAGALTYTLKSVVFNTLYCAHVLHAQWYFFFGETMRAILFVSGMACLAYLIARCYHLTNWFELVCAGIAFTLLYALFSGIAMLDSTDRNNIMLRAMTLRSKVYR